MQLSFGVCWKRKRKIHSHRRSPHKPPTLSHSLTHSFTYHGFFRCHVKIRHVLSHDLVESLLRDLGDHLNSSRHRWPRYQTLGFALQFCCRACRWFKVQTRIRRKQSLFNSGRGSTAQRESDEVKGLRQKGSTLCSVRRRQLTASQSVFKKLGAGGVEFLNFATLSDKSNAPAKATRQFRVSTRAEPFSVEAIGLAPGVHATHRSTLAAD